MASLRLFFSISGRLPRAMFWGITFALCLAGALLAMPLTALPGVSGVPAFFAIVGLVNCVWALAAVRRLHDRGKSGWWLLLLALGELPDLLRPYRQVENLWVRAGVIGLSLLGYAVIIWVFFELFAMPGSIGPNRYGPDARMGFGLASTRGR
jgi:uncharacterized membrane protein YhaH (DUF805 family)